MGLFEVRQYFVRDGKMDEWVEFMETRIVPFVESKGMEPIALFRAEDDSNKFIWIRRFESEGHREDLYRDVYESEEWQVDFKPIVRSLIDVEKAVVHRVVPTRRSPTQ